jgi:hypothetical protein
MKKMLKQLTIILKINDHKVADNVLQPYAVGAFNHCTNLEAQNYE